MNCSIGEMRVAKKTCVLHSSFLSSKSRAASSDSLRDNMSNQASGRGDNGAMQMMWDLTSADRAIGLRFGQGVRQD